jgi:transcriptional regulator with XRE-family HTH domain
LRAIVADLKRARLRQRITLAAVSSRTGIAKPNLSRLENNQRIAPTLDTLDRYAHAVGLAIKTELVPASAA